MIRINKNKIGHTVSRQEPRVLCRLTGMLKSVKKSDIVKLYVYRMEQVMKACEKESEKVGDLQQTEIHFQFW